MRISGPHVHENLAVYFVHGVSAGGAIPLTLQEALAKGSVQVVETGRVNELQIENTGSEEVFIQAGDIVKGGKQDRVLTVSFVLPSKSGTRADRLVLRRAGPLVGARQGGSVQVLECARGDAVARGAAGHGDSHPSRRRWLSRSRTWTRAAEAGGPDAARQRRCREAAQGLGFGRHHARQAVERPQRAAQRAAVCHQPAAHARAREAEGGARRLRHGARGRSASRTATWSATSSPSTAR